MQTLNIKIVQTKPTEIKVSCIANARITSLTSCFYLKRKTDRKKMH